MAAHLTANLHFPQKKSTVSQFKHEDRYGFWVPLWTPYILGGPIKSLQQLQKPRLLIGCPSPYTLLLFQTHRWVRKGCLIPGATAMLSANPRKIGPDWVPNLEPHQVFSWDITLIGFLPLRPSCEARASTHTQQKTKGISPKVAAYLTPSHSFSLRLGSREGYHRMQSSKTWNRAHLQ